MLDPSSTEKFFRTKSNEPPIYAELPTNYTVGNIIYKTKPKLWLEDAKPHFLEQKLLFQFWVSEYHYKNLVET